MSSTRSAPPLVIEPCPDPVVALWIVGIHCAGAATLWLVPLPPVIHIALLVACLWGGQRALDQHVFRRGPEAVVRMVWGQTGDWTITDRAGRRHRVRLVEAVCRQWLILLRFRTPQGRSRHLVLGPHSLSGSVRRRLLVRARLLRFVA